MFTSDNRRNCALTACQFSNTQSPRRLIVFGMLGLLAGFGHHATANAESDARSVPEIKWDTTLRSLQFDSDKFVGQRLTVRCPPAAANQRLDGVHGTDSYPSETALCIAALHAGVITKKGGTVTVQLNPGAPAYKGSQRNGVMTADLPRTPRSIMFVTKSTLAAANKVMMDRIPRIDWDTKFTETGFAHRHLVGQRFTFRCPPAPGDMRSRLVYGTDTYDFASMICRAAVHAGMITTDGGIITVQLNRGVPKLVGSIRNGIETKSKTGGDRSLTFVASPVSK